MKGMGIKIDGCPPTLALARQTSERRNVEDKTPPPHPPVFFRKSAQAIDSRRVAGNSRGWKSEKSAEAIERKRVD